MHTIQKWKKDAALRGDAIIAVDEYGNGHMVIMLTDDDDRIECQEEYDVLSKTAFEYLLPGLYYARMMLYYNYGGIDVEWRITEPLYTIDIKE